MPQIRNREAGKEGEPSESLPLNVLGVPNLWMRYLDGFDRDVFGLFLDSHGPFLGNG